MNELDIDALNAFVNETISQFHHSRIERVRSVNLKEVLKRKNPFLFRAKNNITAEQLVSSVVDAFLSSSEEELFGQFLEELAIYVCGIVYGGQKSAATGLDLDFSKNGNRYIVSIKSGPNWGNKSQYDALKQNFASALKTLQQSSQTETVKPILGICYGRARTTFLKGIYWKVTGQNFWNLISGDNELYKKIVEPIGYDSESHNANYDTEKSKLVHGLIAQIDKEFCAENGLIDWNSLVEFNSGNSNPETLP